MKKVFVGFLLCVVLFGGFFCVSMYRWFRDHTFLHGHGVSFSVKESDDTYQIYASYDPGNTGRVQEYLDEKLRADRTFRNARINGNVVLDDRTNFFIEALPGKLLIRFDRDNNTQEAFLKMKELGDGLKTRIVSR